MTAAAIPVPDPVDTEPSSTPAWVDVVKTLTRPVGCYVTYGLTGLVVAAAIALAAVKLEIPANTLTFIGTILGLGWCHAFQYTWARSAEKKTNAA